MTDLNDCTVITPIIQKFYKVIMMLNICKWYYIPTFTVVRIFYFMKLVLKIQDVVLQLIFIKSKFVRLFFPQSVAEISL